MTDPYAKAPSQKLIDLVHDFETGMLDEHEYAITLRNLDPTDDELQRAEFIVAGELTSSDNAIHAEEFRESLKEME